MVRIRTRARYAFVCHTESDKKRPRLVYINTQVNYTSAMVAHAGAMLPVIYD